MIAEIGTVCFQGIQALPIAVQVQIAGGSLPCFSIVGLPDKAVNESRDRIRSAFHTLGIALPPKRITMNLSPADIQKEGGHYDLPLALGLLIALEILPSELARAIAVGELGLDGTIKPVKGVLPAALLAASQDQLFICPGACGGEAAWSGSTDILAPYHLLQIVNHFKGLQHLPPPEGKIEDHSVSYGDFAEIRGQEAAKRALVIAAAGRHNILMSGPPGTGKSMMAMRLNSLLPPLSPQEALEVTMIHSMVRPLKEGGLIRSRPFRNPHHSVSVASLVGGGFRGLPGEISLAHRGVLFLDELPEFSRPALESLRQSLESGEAVVARANYRNIYPAQFQLVAAMNPCRCGYLGNQERQCHKAPLCGQLYQQSLSGPLLDRIDLFVEVPEVKLADLKERHLEDTSAYLYKHIQRAQEISSRRPPCHNTLDLDKEIDQSTPSKQLLLKFTEKFNLSTRSYYRTIRVARTIADLEGAFTLAPHHVSEALSYRLRNTR